MSQAHYEEEKKSLLLTLYCVNKGRQLTFSLFLPSPINLTHKRLCLEFLLISTGLTLGQGLQRNGLPKDGMAPFSGTTTD